VLGLLLLASLLLGMLLWVVVLNAGGSYDQGFPVAPGGAYWLTIAGLFVDAAVVAAFTLWITSFSTVSMMPVALGLAFAAGGKSLGAVAEYLAKGADGDAAVMALAPVVDSIQWILPDLSRLDWRAWPMYGLIPDTMAMVGGVAMAISYAALLLALAVFTFNRREFQ
jgi:hypothetical protein